MWILAGVAVGYLLFHGRGSSSEGVIRVGDKSKDIEMLQANLNKFLGVPHFQDRGVYDGETARLVGEVFAGTSGLVDDQGTLDRRFLQDFNTVLNKL